MFSSTVLFLFLLVILLCTIIFIRNLTKHCSIF